jgi:pimeloyl-ACP methyl ester carboxylesterase
MRLGTLYLTLLLFAGFAVAEAAESSVKQAKLQEQYEQTLKSLDDDDDAGWQRLAKWCQANHLTKESERAWQHVFERKHALLAKEPTLAGYQSLVTWCSKQGLKQAAEDIRHEMLVFDYRRRKAKIENDDVKGMLSLARWCQKNRLTAEASESWQAVLALDPDNAQARGQLAMIRRDAWAEAPTGLVKHQKVPGYSEDAAWYHISAPKEHVDAEGGLPLIIFLHGGQHNAGTADNVVALAQVIPAFKKTIVLFPNHLKTWWAHPRELKYLLDTVDLVQSRWHVDRKRIYLMGASMGGNGTWGFGSQCPELFAALAPMSGFWAEFLEFPMKNLAAKPVYILHGTQDTTVPIEGARKAFELLKKEGTDVTMCEADCGHQLPNGEIGKAAD